MGARQLIVCCDGTNNNLTGGKADTNVVKALRWMGAPALNQVVFYDPGVGNPGMLPGTTAWERFRRVAERVEGLALGRGVYENVAEAYSFLMANYQPEDELYFFGFSRGAFTARSAAGLVNQFGVLHPHMQSLMPTLLHVYFSSRAGSHKHDVDEVTRDIRNNFCSDPAWQPKVHFVGVWDTVASVGMWPFAAKMSARPTIKGKGFVHVRQALALDEHRGPFKPRIYLDTPAEVDAHQTVIQRWFRGAHCDTGGGYVPERCVISNEALAWMLVEAAECGLRLDTSQVPNINRDAVIEALAPGLIGQPPIVHAETYYNSLWAVGGLTVRSTNVVDLDSGRDESVVASEHESVSQPLSFPRNTVWAKPRPIRQKIDLAILAALALVIYVGIGVLISPAPLHGFGLLEAATHANVQLQTWQMAWWLGSNGYLGATVPQVFHPVAALSADLAMIVCYAAIFSWWAAWSFARVARFTRANERPRRLLVALGHALPIMVFADLAENVATLAALYFATKVGLYLSILLGAAMTMASLTKWVAFAGIIALLAWSLLTRTTKVR